MQREEDIEAGGQEAGDIELPDLHQSPDIHTHTTVIRIESYSPMPPRVSASPRISGRSSSGLGSISEISVVSQKQAPSSIPPLITGADTSHSLQESDETSEGDTVGDGDGVDDTEEEEEEAIEEAEAKKASAEKKRNSRNRLIVSFFVVVALLFGGAGIIQALEKDAEQQLTGEIKTWNYLNSLYFCTVTITTIGYGDITPKTQGGRAFITIYALVSLGVVATFLASIGKILMLRAQERQRAFVKITNSVTRKIKKTKFISRIQKEESMKNVEKDIKKAAPDNAGWGRLFTVLVLILAAIFGGAAVFNKFEGWGYDVCLYYCIITLLTIGYGDFYPTQQNTKIFFICYVFIGLGLVAFLVGDVGEKLVAHTQKQIQEQQVLKIVDKRLRSTTRKVGKVTGKAGNLLFKRGSSEEKTKK